MSNEDQIAELARISDSLEALVASIRAIGPFRELAVAVTNIQTGRLWLDEAAFVLIDEVIDTEAAGQ